MPVHQETERSSFAQGQRYKGFRLLHQSPCASKHGAEQLVVISQLRQPLLPFAALHEPLKEARGPGRRVDGLLGCRMVEDCLAYVLLIPLRKGQDAVASNAVEGGSGIRYPLENNLRVLQPLGHWGLAVEEVSRAQHVGWVGQLPCSIHGYA
eukprot:scaffold5500_cov248-Pinguiococcus_pyrenoidosus.AAC.2